LCLIALVWATAVSTVLAGVPQTVCRCQPFPATDSEAGSTQKMGCCRGGTCADPIAEGNRAGEQQPRANQYGKTGRTCCSHKSEGQPDGSENVANHVGKTRGSSPQVDPGGCHKEVVTSQVISSVDQTKKAGEEARSSWGLVFFFSQAIPSATPSSESRSLAVCEPPPPADLVTTFQRLTI